MLTGRHPSPCVNYTGEDREMEELEEHRGRDGGGVEGTVTLYAIIFMA